MIWFYIFSLHAIFLCKVCHLELKKKKQQQQKKPN